MSIEQEILKSISEAGFTGDLTRQWYDAIYCHPNLSFVRLRMQKILPQITTADLRRLLNQASRGRSLEFVRFAVGYFRKLFNAPEVAKFYEIYEEECWLQVSQEPKANRWSVGANLDYLRSKPINEVIAATAHETWHLYQSGIFDDWYLRTGGDNPTDIAPNQAGQDLRYAVNYNFNVEPKQSLELYKSQLIEREAAYVEAVIRHKILALFAEMIAGGAKIVM